MASRCTKQCYRRACPDETDRFWRMATAFVNGSDSHHDLFRGSNCERVIERHTGSVRMTSHQCIPIEKRASRSKNVPLQVLSCWPDGYPKLSWVNVVFLSGRAVQRNQKKIAMKREAREGAQKKSSQSSSEDNKDREHALRHCHYSYTYPTKRRTVYQRAQRGPQRRHASAMSDNGLPV